jgi:RimJ/RimL family protein N-acetyltransferase
MLTIRPTEIGDAAALAACIEEVARERRFLASTVGFSVDQIEDFIRFFVGQGGVQLVALDGPRIVGWCDIVPGQLEGISHAGHLGMGLLGAYRGQGAGRALLAHALARAFAGNFERIDLDVFDNNLQAIKLYRAAGFREEGRKRRARKLDGAWADVLVYGMLREEWGGGD